MPSGLTVPMNPSPGGSHSAWPWLHKTLHVIPGELCEQGECWLTSAFKSRQQKLEFEFLTMTQLVGAIMT